MGLDPREETLLERFGSLVELLNGDVQETAADSRKNRENDEDPICG